MYCWEEPIHQADGEEKYLKYYSPFYLEQIAPIPARQEQWARIKKANANHRSFSLFSSKEEACEDISLLGSYKDLEERGDAAWSDCFISNIDAEKLNAEIWQLTLLEFNPEFIGWELGEDREWVKRNRWDREFYFDTWRSFRPRELGRNNELVDFYFSVRRANKACKNCNGTGLTPEANEIGNDWLNWCDKLTQEEVDVLCEMTWLGDYLDEKPTADEVNSLSRQENLFDSEDRDNCIKIRTERLGIEHDCNHCQGRSYFFTAEHAHASLTLWFRHQSSGCSSAIEVCQITQDDLPVIYKYLQDAAQRNAEIFEKLPI